MRTGARWIVVVLVGAAAGGCGRGDSDSTPLGAMRSYAAALDRGDAAAAEGLITGGNPAAADALVGSIVSRRKLAAAAEARFGAEGRRVLGAADLPQADYDRWLSDAEVKELGNAASVGPRDHRTEPVAMRKVNGHWRIDLSETPGLDQLASMLPLEKSIDRANAETADEIAAGKYPTADAAKAALNQKMLAALSDSKHD